MVERLKDAITKARARREGGPGSVPAGGTNAGTGPVAAPSAQIDELWNGLTELPIDADKMRRERIVSFQKTDPSHVTFDVLRTRLLKVMRENGWTKLAITSPTKGCGKTVITMNLAFSLSRHPNFRTMLIDMDLKAPRVASVLGASGKRQISWFLTGQTAPEKYMNRIGDNLAVALNNTRVRDSAELIESQQTEASLAHAQRLLRPEIVLFDLPPMLVNDDALAFTAIADCVMLVISAGESKAADIDECERLLSANCNFLGILLNKHRDPRRDPYSYGYGYGYGGYGGYGYGSGPGANNS
ncbi:MAG: CpsD/CapB family tyrosine-protein kinase [Pseudomonadota bacterium]